MAYSSPLWVFQIFPHMDLNRSPSLGFGELWKKLTKSFMKLMRACAGTHPKTSSIAILVRLGKLPLRYQLALPALCEVYRILKNPVPGAENMMQQLRDHPSGVNGSVIIGPAITAIAFFNRYADGDLMDPSISNARIFRTRLITAMYKAADAAWKSMDVGAHTRSIHPTWHRFRILTTERSKIVENWYITAGFRQNRTLNFKAKISPVFTHPCCRACGGPVESVDHVILSCPKFAEERIKMKCRMGGGLTMQNALGNNEFKQSTEQFIAESKIHKIFT
jgi:hypothetical protein